MRNTTRKLFLEMAAIVLVATVVGVIWNRGMLNGVWRGTTGGAAASVPASADRGGLPLPAGLMQVKEMYAQREAVLVDARDELTFARGHIKGAVSLPVGQFEAKSGEFARKVPFKAAIVVYCNGYGCHDSMTVGKMLMSKGYRQVYVFEGGYPEWRDGGLPVEGQNP